MTDNPTVTAAFLRDWALPTPDSGGGKESRGTVGILGGSVSTPGAVLLAGLAALRSGAGKLTIATVEAPAPTLAVAIPESGVTGLPMTSDGTLGASAVDAAVEAMAKADAVVIGPGLTGPADTKAFVRGLLERLDPETTIVLDAMGLSCGALDGGLPDERRGRVIGTPNEKEASYLLGAEGDTDPVDDDTALVLARKLGAVIALQSTVAAPDGRCWRDGSGDVGLGTSGSGDVLAGIVGGLAARGASPEQAAVWGVHLHAEAGDRLAAKVGRVGFLARELLDEVPYLLSQFDR